MQAIGAWLRRSSGPLTPVVPGLQDLVEWAEPLPADLVDLVAFEVPLTGPAAPPSLHLRVPRERAAELRRYECGWLGDDAPRALAAVAEIAEQGLDGGERGFVCEPFAGGYHVGAAYANVPQGAAGRTGQADAIASVLGVPGRSRAFLARLDALAETTHVGAMVGRPGTPTRVVVRLRPDSPVWPLLADTAGRAAATAARDLARSRPESEVLLLNIDLLDGQVGPSLGLEIKPSDTGQSLVERSAALHRLLDESGVDDRISAALIDWQGRSVLGADGGPPTPTDLNALLHGAERPGMLQRVNHVKVSLAPSGVASLKAYVFVFRVLLQRSQAADD